MKKASHLASLLYLEHHFQKKKTWKNKQTKKPQQLQDLSCSKLPNNFGEEGKNDF